MGWWLPLLAYADMPAPDDNPSLINMDVYRDLRETGDRLYMWQANIPYATIPDLIVSDAFIWQLLDTDNVTVLGSTTGYAFNESGYGHNIFSLYFSAADALTWEETYILRLSGNPSAFASPPVINYPVNVSDYTSLTGSADNKAVLAVKIIEYAATLDIQWGKTGTDSLLLQTETGTVLSIYGEAVFRGCIYAVQSLAPAAFRIVIGDMDAPDRVWTTTYADNLTTQYTGTWIETSKLAGATLFGTSYDFASVLMALGIGIMLFIGVTYLVGKTALAFLLVTLWLVYAPKLDFFPLAVTALICALFIIYEGTKIKGMIR